MEQFEKLLQEYRDAVAARAECNERPDPYDTHRYDVKEEAAKKALIDYVQDKV